MRRQRRTCRPERRVCTSSTSATPRQPDVEAFIALPCGSHTATGVPDPKNKRLIVYSTPSSGDCDGIDVIEIPLRDPSAATYHHFEAAADLIACHDTGVILGKVLRAACAGGQGFAVWSMDPNDGGSLIDPKLLYTKNMKASWASTSTPATRRRSPTTARR